MHCKWKQIKYYVTRFMWWYFFFPLKNTFLHKKVKALFMKLSK